MEDKYYTPTIDEFHVGFEYEIFENWDTIHSKQWYKQVYGRDGNNPERMGYVGSQRLNDFRVKYLDKEDIESLGFVQMTEDERKHFGVVGDSFLKKFDVRKNGKHHALIIQFDFPTSGYIRVSSKFEGALRGYGNTTTLFLGVIKNKSKLLDILNMIGFKC